jgi:hypothetical protein
MVISGKKRCVDPSLGPMPESDTEFFWRFRLPDNRLIQSRSLTTGIKPCF